MKKLYFRIAVVLVGIAGMGITTKAQAVAVDQLSVTVPFEFVVDGTTLPAGMYRLHRLSDANPSGGLVLSSYENRVTSVVFPIDIENAIVYKPQLIFETIGGQRVLSRIQTGDNVFDIPIAKSSNNMMLATKAKSSLGNPGGK